MGKPNREPFEAQGVGSQARLGNQLQGRIKQVRQEEQNGKLFSNTGPRMSHRQPVPPNSTITSGDDLKSMQAVQRKQAGLERDLATLRDKINQQEECTGINDEPMQNRLKRQPQDNHCMIATLVDSLEKQGDQLLLHPLQVVRGASGSRQHVCTGHV